MQQCENIKNEKQHARYQRKLKKMQAFLALAELNDQNGRGKKASTAEPQAKRSKLSETTDDDQSVETMSSPKAVTKDDKLVATYTLDQYNEYKQKLRERQKRYRHSPKFRLKYPGEKAAINVVESERIPLYLSDIQHLLMYSQLGHHSPYSPTRWCQLEKYNHLSQTVVILVENVSMYHFSSYESQLPFVKSVFDNKLEIITPVSFKKDIIHDLVLVPLTGAHKNKLVAKYGTLETAVQLTGDIFKTLRCSFPITPGMTPELDKSGKISLPKSDKFPRTSLLLSIHQLIQENYPVLLKGELNERYADYVYTKDEYKEVTPFSPMFGLDCEMCKTTTGNLELTRISVVDEQLQIFYEQLVKPDNAITDYLTRYSGITPAILKDVTTKLKDVQNDLREKLPPDAILVGQSLNFDLHTLKMIHPYIIDTSVIFNMTGERTRKTKLQVLANKFLSANIQQSRSGHCSIEDSTTSIRLAQLKLSKNLDYGDEVLKGKRKFEKKYICLEEKTSKIKFASGDHDFEDSYASHVFKHLTVDGEKNAFIVGCNDIIDVYSQFVNKSELMQDTKKSSKTNDDKTKNSSQTSSDTPNIVCKKVNTNEEIIRAITSISQRYSFTLGHLRIPCDYLENNESNVLGKIDKWLKEVWDSLALHSLCVVIFTGQQQGSSGVAMIELKRLAHMNDDL